MTSGTAEKGDLLRQLAEKYIRGNGIETGSAPNGVPIPPRVRIRRVPEPALTMDAGKTVAADKPLANLDFCIAGDIEGNAGDPLTFLHRCLQVLRPGGILFILIPCVSDPPDHPGSVHGPLFLGAPRASVNVPDAGIRKILHEEKIRTLPVRIRWQGDHVTAGSRKYVVILERFDYLVQVQELLQKKVASMENMPCPVDVIIPVYNARDDLLRCLYSLMVHHENERIILIDDKSTDPDIGSLFSSLEPFRSSWFVLIRQEKNSGFAAAVNRGICHSQNDVIILNSDTIVTSGWAKKLQEGAGIKKTCGTLTPLSNNGTLCSVPVMMENNLLPPGVCVDDYADMVETISFKQFPTIPAGIGFCLYITRACLDATGNFDEVTFRAGYGEETDFCLRAGVAGMTHHVCDTTFIYHRGMASFSGEAKRRLQKGIAALNARYPSYQEQVSGFIQDNPLLEIQENIACRAVTWDFSGCSCRVLLIPDPENLSLYHRQAEKSGDNERYYIFSSTPSEYCVSEYNRGDHLDYAFRPDAPSPEADRIIIEKILCSFRISCICPDHPDTRVSECAAKFHIPCMISSFSSIHPLDKENGTARAPFMKSCDTFGSGFPDEQRALSLPDMQQEPDGSSGRQFTSEEIFHSIRAFPKTRFGGIIPFRPETPGSLPSRFLDCLSENGVLYTLQRIRFFFMHTRKNE